MPNLMDSVQFTPSIPHNNAPQNEDIFSMIERAKNDPRGFEEMVKKTNPQGYQLALQIRNSQNPRAMVIEMARAQNVNPNIYRILGLR